MTLEAVFWDVGGVFSARPTDAIASAAAEVGVDADRLWTVVFGDYHADDDHPWQSVTDTAGRQPRRFRGPLALRVCRC